MIIHGSIIKLYKESQREEYSYYEVGCTFDGKDLKSLESFLIFRFFKCSKPGNLHNVVVATGFGNFCHFYRSFLKFWKLFFWKFTFKIGYFCQNPNGRRKKLGQAKICRSKSRAWVRKMAEETFPSSEKSWINFSKKANTLDNKV